MGVFRFWSSLVGSGVYNAVCLSSTSFCRALPTIGRCIANNSLLFGALVVSGYLIKNRENIQVYNKIQNAIKTSIPLILIRFSFDYYFGNKLTYALGGDAIAAENSKIALYGVFPRIVLWAWDVFGRYFNRVNVSESACFVREVAAPITLFFFTNQATKLYKFSYLAGSCLASFGKFAMGVEDRLARGCQGRIFENGKESICFGASHLAAYLLADYFPGIGDNLVRIAYNTVATTILDKFIAKPCMSQIESFCAKIKVLKDVQNSAAQYLPYWS